MFNLNSRSTAQNRPTKRRQQFSVRRLEYNALEPRRLLAAVTGVWLVNADSDSDITALTDGAVIDLQTLSTSSLNVRATTDGPVDDVRFSLSGPTSHNQTERVAPYALFGDNSGNYAAGSFAVGQYTLVVTPNSAGADTPLTVNFSVVGGTTTPTPGVYQESNGLVVMEMENTPSDLGLWQQKTEHSGYTGDGYLQFLGNSHISGPPNSPLEYKFRIDTPGLYYLHLRSRKDNSADPTRTDISNDAYVRVEGDYLSGPGPHTSHGDNASLNMLQSNTKFFGGNLNNFAWNSGNQLDPGGHNNKRVAVYDFKAGEEYTLVVSGRSKFYNIDRIVFRHENTSVSVAQNLSTPESQRGEFIGEDGDGSVAITGELKKWHKTNLTLDGPAASENGTNNPFTNYRMNVTFTHQASGTSYLVPGYFAADGDAANTGATSGNQWRAHLAADQEGVWDYSISFRSGTNVATNDSATAGTALAPYDGVTGQFTIGATDKTGDDLRGKGRLEYVGEHYLQFAENGEYFLKQGTDAPENLLAYADIDGDFKNDGNYNTGTFNNEAASIKQWNAHVGDWNPGDPTWSQVDGASGSFGKGLIGAVNYLASEELNAISFLTMNINGDDRNVFPYTTYSERNRMDVSKLDQWEIVFEHGDKQGMYLHFKTQETENDQLLDGGGLGNQRKLYYRELIARFSHHLAMNWNLGEETSNTTQQLKDFADYFHDNDPYQHNIVLHTFPAQKEQRYNPLLGSASELTGASLQTNQANFANVHNDTVTWVTNSAAAGQKWVVAVDEPGDAQRALRPDNDAGTSHTDARKNALWGTFMAGGAGNEWYFGYGHAHSDLTAEDFRSRDQFWDYTRHAKSFFEDNNIPFWEMVNDNSISTAGNDYGFYKSGEVYTVYLKNGGTTNLDLSAASSSDIFSVQWFDPRNGGGLQDGTVAQVNGGGVVSLGQAPNNVFQDWAILVTAPVEPGVVNRGVAYGGASPSIGEDTIDPTKTAYQFLPGTTASPENYTNYTKGLNRIIVDIAGSTGIQLTNNDLVFRVGNTNDPSNWTLVDGTGEIPLPTISSTPPDASGIQRFTLAWPDLAIHNQWLQVTIKSTSNTELDAPDIFYFGNQIGDVSDSTPAGQHVRVNSFDLLDIKLNQGSNPNHVANQFDVNRSGDVDAFDLLDAKFNQVTAEGLLMLAAPIVPAALQVVATTPDISPPSDTDSVVAEVPLASPTVDEASTAAIVEPEALEVVAATPVISAPSDAAPLVPQIPLPSPSVGEASSVIEIESVQKQTKPLPTPMKTKIAHEDNSKQTRKRKAALASGRTIEAASVSKRRALATFGYVQRVDTSATSSGRYKLTDLPLRDGLLSEKQWHVSNLMLRNDRRLPASSKSPRADRSLLIEHQTTNRETENGRMDELFAADDLFAYEQI